MTGTLPINIDNLLRQRTVEGERIEYKTGWNPKAVLHTPCAFANDFHNLGGGYVVLGVEAHDGRPVLPPKGILSEAIGYIERNYLKETVVKHPHKPEAERFWNFPIGAIEEALVNAIYHRSYEEREPVEARISAEELMVLSFPGADRSIRMEDFRKGQAVSRRYRNRRIGEFLKELDLAEGRSTGVPKIYRAMRQNGSPDPAFESDEDRTWFLVRLPVRERVSLAATEHVDRQDTLQDKTLETQEKNRDTPQDALQVTVRVERLITVLAGMMNRAQLQEAIRLRDRSHFTSAYLKPALDAGLIEMTLPDKPTSPNQRYRRTAAGEALAQKIGRKGAPA